MKQNKTQFLVANTTKELLTAGERCSMSKVL